MDEDDLKWVVNTKMLVLKQFHEHFRSKTTRFLEINLLNDALMHRDDLKGYYTIYKYIVSSYFVQ